MEISSSENLSRSSKAISSSRSSEDARSLNSFFCEECETRFLIFDDLVQHKLSVHPRCWPKLRMLSLETEPERHTCTYCKACFPTIGALDRHRISVHQPIWIKGSMSSLEIGHVCSFCEMCFPSSEALDQHYSSSYDHPSATLPAVKTGQEDEHNEIEEDGKESWFTDRRAVSAFRRYAEVALEHYNNQNVGKKYALVEHGPIVTIGVRGHLNFKAKEEDCSSVPVETFFAQLTFHPRRTVDCCLSLGPSDKLPPWRKAELGGCQFCRGLINHPTEWVANLTLKESLDI